jgi:hypothetical protein
MGIDVQTPLYRLPPGQLAALSWLTEAASQSALSQVAAGRNLPVDFDDFLRDVPAGLHRVLGHFGLPDDDATIETLCDSDAFRRYSKAQDVAYTGETRAGQLADSFKRHGADIAAGMKLLERIGSMNPHAAQLMGAAGLPSGPGALPA